MVGFYAILITYLQFYPAGPFQSAYIPHIRTLAIIAGIGD